MSADLISLGLSAKDVQAFEDLVKVVPKAIEAAQRRSINKTLGWLRTHIGRAVSKEEKIAATAVRQRLRSYPMQGGSKEGKLWFGMNPIEASRIGRPRQSRAGVSVAGRRYRGAFYKSVYGGKSDIWIRKASKHFKAEDYPDSTISTGGGPSSGWIAENGDRFPLVKAKVSLEDVEAQFNTWAKKADERLLVVFKQEMNFELHKYLKGTARV